MHLAKIGWFMRHHQLLQIQQMFLRQSFSIVLLQFSNIQRLFFFQSLLFMVEPLEVKFLLLLSQALHTFVRSLNLFASVLCNEKFSLSPARCLKNSGSERVGSLRSRRGFPCSFNGRLRSIFRFRKAIDILTSLFQIFVVFRSHVAQSFFQIIFQCIGICCFICEGVELFVFTKCFGHCFFTRFNQTFNSYFPFCAIDSFN